MSDTVLPLQELPSRKPAEVVEGARPAQLSSVGLAILLATLTMAVFGSGALLDWTSALPIGPVSDFLVDLAVRWHELMTGLGLAHPAETLRHAERALQALAW